MKATTIATLEVLALAAFAAAPARATSYTFTQLPLYAEGLNDVGQIVGLAPAYQNGLPVVYNNGAITSLGFPKNQATDSIVPSAINNTGLIVAQEVSGHSSGSITFQLGTTSIIQSTIAMGSGPVISGENNKGETVEYTASFPIPIGPGYTPSSGPGGSISVPSPYSGVFALTYATGINDAEQVVGHVDFRLSSGAAFVPPGSQGYREGFLLSGGAYTTFVVPGASETDPVAINDGGEIVGTFTDATGTHGFEDENGVFSTIVGPNGGDFLPVGLNSLGQLVGATTPLSGQTGVSYLATPQAVPEPSTLALLGAGLLGLVARRSWAGKRDARPIRPPAIH